MSFSQLGRAILGRLQLGAVTPPSDFVLVETLPNVTLVATAETHRVHVPLERPRMRVGIDEDS